MNKRKPGRPRKLHPTLKEVFEGYNLVDIVAILNTFENTEAWKLFQAYANTVQRRFEVDALDCMSKDGEEKKAAYASGYAKACEDIQNSFMEGLKQTAMGFNPVIENPREEDKEPVTQFD